MRKSRLVLYAAAIVAAVTFAIGHRNADSHGMLAQAVADGTRCLPSTFESRQVVIQNNGFISIRGGEFSMGSGDPRFNDALPWHRVRLTAFGIGRTEVTNAQFAEFVRATNYVTVAERRPTAAEAPGVPAEDLVAGGLVFTPPDHPVPLNDDSLWWRYVPGANWRHPTGPGSTIRSKPTYPVVQVAYDDALAYAHWAHGRLPTEAEYEFAQRGGASCKTYAWGNDEMPSGTMPANVYMGHFPDKSDNGTPGVKPVASYPPNGYGLYDMTGNVWEWTGDWYRSDYYKTLALTNVSAKDPTGPGDSYDPVEPGVAKRSVRGGSFLCTDQFCSRFETGGRGEAEPRSATNHTGFRIVRTL